jgi:putative tricarboxylic transport membrane protein
MGGKKHNTDRISAIVVLIFSCIFLWQLKYISSPLDVVFPRTILIGMIALSTLLLAKSFLRPDPKSQKALFDIENRGKVITGVFGTIAWLVLIPLLGFAVTSVIALMLLSQVLGTPSDRTLRKSLSSVLVSVIIVGAVYYFLSEFMEVQLPRGILF